MRVAQDPSVLGPASRGRGSPTGPTPLHGPTRSYESGEEIEALRLLPFLAGLASVLNKTSLDVLSCGDNPD